MKDEIQGTSYVEMYSGLNTRSHHKNHTSYNGHLQFIRTVYDTKEETPSPTFYVFKQEMIPPLWITLRMTT